MAEQTKAKKDGVVTPIAGGDTSALSVPHSQDAERALLGALLLNNELYNDIDGTLEPEHFYVSAHGKVYGALSRLLNRDQVADPVSLTNFFGSDEWFTDIGGRDFLEELNENASTIINVRTYADIIFNHYMARQLISIGTDLVNEAYDTGPDNTPAKLVNDTEGRLFNLAENGNKGSGFQSLKDPIVQVIEQIELAKKSDSHLTGITTGLKDVDGLLGGLQRSDLIILAARPSMGKTSLAMNMALNAARAAANNQQGGGNVAIFSFEMSTEQLASRLLSSSAGVSTTSMAHGNLKADEFTRIATAADELSSLKLFIDDTPQLTVPQMRSRARRLKRQQSIDFIVVDYLQLMRGSGRASDNRVNEISEISQGLKALARELNVPVVALSQLSRGVESRENKRPLLSDLRESGSIEQDADIVMFLYREAYYKEREFGADPTPEQQAALEEIRNISELLISKNRKGSTGQLKLIFDGPTTTFKDYTTAEYS